MKKLFLLALLLMTSVSLTNAQTYVNYQFNDPGFEGEDTEDEIIGGNNDWRSFADAIGDQSGFKDQSPAPELITGENAYGGSGTSIKLKSVSLVLAKANGNLTTGYVNMGSTTPENKANHNVSRVSEGLAMEFVGIPDAIGCWAKFIPGYYTTGFLSGKKYYYNEAARGRFIIHDANVDYKDPENTDADYDGSKIAEAAIMITPTGTYTGSGTSKRTYTEGEWTYFEAPFTYYDNENEGVEQYLLASFTTNPTPGETQDDYLWIDDVYFVYYSTLSSLKYDGVELLTGSETGKTISIDLSDKVYDKTKVTYTLKGRGATEYRYSYNANTGILQIIIRGNDYSASKNQTTYKIQFKKPGTGALTAMSVNDTPIDGFAKNSYYYTVEGEYTEGCIEYTQEDGTDATTVINYDEESRIATVKTTATVGGASKTYYVKFAKPTITYIGKMLIAMDDALLAASDDPVGISASVDGKVDFQLRNFYLEGVGVVGDVFVTDVPYIENEDGSVSLNKTQTITIFGQLGASLGELPITLTGKVKDGLLSATISIVWTEDLIEHPIEVKVYPYNSAAIDASSYAGAAAAVADIKTNMTNPNLLVYVPDGEITEGTDNVVAGAVCSSYKVVDVTNNHEFYIPYAFTATTASYTRSFNATADYVSSFVLPVAVPAANINGTVYELVGYEDGVLNFAEVTTTLEANKPYIVKATSANLLNDANNVSVAATTEATLENAVSGGAVHVGSYTSQSVASDASTSFYGYKGGVFVKANSGTLNPFRTMIKVSGEQSLSTLALSFDGEVTGIGSIVDGELQLNGTVNVYDLNGRLVRQGAKAANSLQGLPTGVYVVNGQKVMVK